MQRRAINVKHTSAVVLVLVAGCTHPARVRAPYAGVVSCVQVEDSMTRGLGPADTLNAMFDPHAASDTAKDSWTVVRGCAVWAWVNDVQGKSHQVLGTLDSLPLVEVPGKTTPPSAEWRGDKWGTPYRLVPGDSGTFVLLSAGPDKQFGTPDDIRLNR